jgi:hypothetical protein
VQAAEVLTADNWRRAVRQAINALPPDVRRCIGYSEPHAKAVQLTAMGPGAAARTVLFTWRDSPHVPCDPDAEPLAAGADIVETWAAFAADVILDAPIGDDLVAFRVGHHAVADFARAVQEAAVAEVAAAGGCDIAQDGRGRFVRPDGSPVLEG